VRARIQRLRVMLCRRLCAAGEDVCGNADGTLTNASFIFVTSPQPGQRVSSGFTIEGCSRSSGCVISVFLLAMSI
jgi:hypothetical protein